MTDLESMNKQHASIRHHATLKRDKIPPYQVRLQHVDGKFFRVKGKIIHEIDAIEEKLETAKEGLSTEKSAGVVGLLPSWLKYLPGCRAVFFPVQKLDTTAPTQNNDKTRSSYLQWLERASTRRAAPSIYSFDSSNGGATSIMSTETTTYRSLRPNVKLKDTYSDEERREILKNLWTVHMEQDLIALSESEVKRKCRELALRTGEESIRAFRRFDVAIIQALLWTQHEIILVEERLSRSDFSGGDLPQLTEHLQNYGKPSLLNTQVVGPNTC